MSTATTTDHGLSFKNNLFIQSNHPENPITVMAFQELGSKVGIGVGDPDFRLHIEGGAGDTGNWTQSLKLQGSHPTICFHGSAKRAFIGYDNASTTNGLQLTVAGSDDNMASSTMGIKIRDSGDVGIGIGNPSRKLDVAGSAQVRNRLTINQYDVDGGWEVQPSLYLRKDPTATGPAAGQNIYSVVFTNVNGLALHGNTTNVDNNTFTPHMLVADTGKVGVNTTNFSYTKSDNSPIHTTGGNAGISNNVMFVNGSVQLLGQTDAFVCGRGTATHLKDEELAFGWGGGWYMTDGTYLRVRNNKYIYSTGGATFGSGATLGSARVLGQESRFGSEDATPDTWNGTDPTRLLFQDHGNFWIGAGNGTWFTGAANTKTQASGLAADATYAHDLLLTTMYSTASYDRGITFAVADNTSGGYSGTNTTAGYRLGKWHSGISQASSQLAIDGGLTVKGGYTDMYDYFADDYSLYHDESRANSAWGGDTGWIDPSIMAAGAIQIQTGNKDTNTNNPALQFHQYGYGGVQMRYDGPNNTLFVEDTSTDGSRLDRVIFASDNRSNTSGTAMTLSVTHQSADNHGSGIDLVSGQIGGSRHYSPFIRFYDTTNSTSDITSAAIGDLNWALGISDTDVSSFRLQYVSGAGGTKANTITSGFTRLYIDGPSGYTGIGTDEPEARLHTVINTTANSTARAALARWEMKDNSNVNFDIFGDAHTNRPGWFQIGGWNADVGIAIVSDTKADVEAGTTNNGIFIKNGNVGLGVTDPVAKFEVVGDSGQLFSIVDDMTGIIFSVNDSSGIPSIEVEDDGTVTLAEFGGRVNIGIPATTTALVNVGGTIDAVAFDTNSDRALKHDIKPIEHALDKVKSLGGYTFKYNSTGKESVGVIAQEVEQVLPQLVSGEEGEKSVSYGNMVGLLIEAIKEQQQTIEAQQARIEALEQHIK